ncbi:ATP-binding protein [Pedosphaera parvula]|uniref:Integral membrane sensor signal transduction histidine kinase n=1 Tax=Pedosphaera parvula (strain Ellin514) TaxID=320771 RepID=B9XH39_PEDPL|nr:ATP-binding protein [Pedosphaera parvula]EEF60960.1 integral membrane sensor signal transduction histidine kinase [Pedosphaera parvula Ellin514]
MFPIHQRQRGFGFFFRCICLLATLLAASTHAANGPAFITITNLQELCRAVETRQRVECDVDLTVTVCAADAAACALVLQDDSGRAVCELDAPGRVIFPGERLRISATRCELIRRQWSVAIAAAPVVNIGGIHPVEEKSGRIHLEAGLQPIRLFYFNAKNPANLAVRWSGPKMLPQPVPAGALFRAPAGVAGGTNQITSGLDYFCYDDTPATLDDVRNQMPTLAGTAINFDIALRVPEEYVAMQFRGWLAVPRTGEYEFTVRSDDGSELYVGGFHPKITLLASNTPPTASRAWLDQSPAAPPNAEWVTLDGRISFVGQEADGLVLGLQSGNHALRLWLANPGNISPSLLLNAIVRATGLLRQVAGLDGQKQFGIMSVVGAANFQVREIAAEQWDKYPLTSIASLSTAPPGNFIAHLHGRVSGLQPDGNFILDDGFDTIPVRAEMPSLTNGLDIEVLGQFERDGVKTVAHPAYCRPLARPPTTLPLLTTAAQVQQLSVSEAARQYPVRMRGVVTCQVEWLGAAVQDDTRGVFFNFDTAYHDGLEVGDFVEINGVTAAGDFAPVIVAKTLLVQGRGQMPEPARPSWNQLISGSLDSQYAEVRGIITAVQTNTVTLLTDGGKINVQVHNTSEATLRRLQNTLVRIRGCLLAEWDAQTRQVRVGEIKFRNPVIEAEQLPVAEPFAAPVKTIADLLRFDLHASGFQRVKVSGQVVHAGDDEFFLMSDGRGLRFRPADLINLSVGDLVDVVGIPDVSGPSPVLHEALARKTGSAPLPMARPWPDAEFSRNGLDAARVVVDARLIGIHHTDMAWMLDLQTGLRSYQALFNTPEDLARKFPLGSRLRLTGIYAAPTRGQKSDLSSFVLLLNSAADIQLLERPPWWNLRRLLFIVVALLLGLLAAVGWITQLRHKVEQRTRLLEREHVRREKAERERALEMERSRIARDLHDDLGSSLTEIRVMASTGLRSREADARAFPLFTAIAGKAHSLVSALDVIVWAVDPEANSLQSLADYLSSYAADYLGTANIACRFKIPVSLPATTVNGRMRHDLFLAVKETLHNIVQHSHATEVEFHLRTVKQLLEIDIVDNGLGFDLEAAIEQGHGLKNIPERLARMGGSAQLTSLTGRGTTVSIRLLLPAATE